MLPSSPRSLSEEELKANALKAANGRSFARRGIRIGWFWEQARVLVLAFAMFLVLRTFLVEAYKIPSGSMEKTLLVGDFLLVNKLVYGARIPFTSWQTPAIRAPHVGDIVVFVYPVDPTKNYIKRLVGVAGDTLSMANGVLVRNQETISERYVVRSDTTYDPVSIDFAWQRKFLVGAAPSAITNAAYPPTTSESSSRVLSAATIGITKNVLGTSTSIAGTYPQQVLGGDSATTIARGSQPYRPSRDNWGPIVVPEGHSFMLGDNRDNSEDSRYWGFVADSLVRGTPMVVYYSFSPDETAAAPWLTRIRWSRFGSRVR